MKQRKRIKPMSLPPPRALLDFRDYLRGVVDTVRHYRPANLLTAIMAEYQTSLKLAYPQEDVIEYDNAVEQYCGTLVEISSAAERLGEFAAACQVPDENGLLPMVNFERLRTLIAIRECLDSATRLAAAFDLQEDES